jgi:hypothetical protein
MKIKEISEEQYNHYFHKWLYTYGGTSDVKTLKEFINEYDSDVYGDIDIYSTSVCPCVMCIGEDIV